MVEYDLIVIGGGSGGLTAASGAASMGAKVALIDDQPGLGGDCLHFGCVPSKAFITAAKEVHAVYKGAAEFGLTVSGDVLFERAIERVKEAIDEIQEIDSDERFESLGVDIYRGKGAFKDEHTITIDGENPIKGKRIVISTGSRPNVPPINGVENVSFITNETIFNLDYLPKSVVFIGGGPVGLELAQSLSRFGSDVTVIETSQSVFKKEDHEIIPIVTKALEKELTFVFEADVTGISEKNGHKVVTYKVNGEEKTIESEAIMMSTGRKPNTDKLNLEAAGVNENKGYITVNESLQTNKSHIYAIGDVNGAFPFTHGAGMEGKLIVQNAVFGLKRKVNYDNVPWVTYTEPEVFHLGLTEQEAKEKHGEEIRVFKVGTDDVDRFIAERKKDGLVKVITDKKGHILGAHAVGEDSGSWMQEIVFAKEHGHKIGDISTVIHPYPTKGAILNQAADMYWREKLFDGWLPKVSEKYIKWVR
ncbi:dihydrolipoyl dehydrogenase family protein [Guptibacillus hwajinpoensis]|uniref:Pyruvate/2-oxoglutarate dehydrogenase complex dihydrolipoamide dehydrogenase (E3) component n=1 Tax=Guptibacillus hwajinpoensis TaxID=208199 RepID=A0ABU0JXR5_9BACL|nr:FAD-dependent oxidoreductase [Alkalihalobacillus hemicentroti]MDQ0481879.1 pyruvate/2-oxoglutarate dehydrogenase complex dihydrolipoamide dehydrogenase (E3) component [Alkalihalobacillus hemicentroti]